MQVLSILILSLILRGYTCAQFESQCSEPENFGKPGQGAQRKRGRANTSSSSHASQII